METSNSTGNPNFQYEEVVEAVRKSPYAYRFDFEKYDSEQASGHKSTDLFFKFVDKEPGSNYSYPTYKNTNLRLRRFFFSTRKNRALPRIESSKEYCRYKTIEQLLEMLAIVVPRIDYLEKGILEDEQKDIRRRRIQDVFSSTVPDLVKSIFAGSGLGYWYEMRRDSILLLIRLPKNLRASYIIKFNAISEEVQRAINIAKDLSATLNRYGQVVLGPDSGNDVIWTES